jgi:hypothetical protein
MDSLQEAVRINNRGVQHLCNGDIAASFPSFQQAVAISRSIIGQENDPLIVVPAQVRSNGYSCFHERPNVLPGLQSSYYVYDRAILLPRDLAISDARDMEHIGCVTRSSVIFNLALASHSHGKNTGHSESLRRACMLYDVLIRVLDGTGGNDTSLGVLKCLALNNFAAIHHELGNFDQSSNCIVTLEHQMVSFDVHLEEYLDVAEAEGLRLNVELMEPPMMAGAA